MNKSPFLLAVGIALVAGTAGVVIGLSIPWLMTHFSFQIGVR